MPHEVPHEFMPATPGISRRGAVLADALVGLGGIAPRSVVAQDEGPAWAAIRTYQLTWMAVSVWETREAATASNETARAWVAANVLEAVASGPETIEAAVEIAAIAAGAGAATPAAGRPTDHGADAGR